MSFMSTRASNGLPIVLILLSACLISMVTFGPRTALGIFQTPILSDNGWSREVFGLALGLQNLLWGIGQPFAGAVADRFDPIKVLIVGAALHALGLLTMAYADTPFLLSLGAGVLIGFALSAASFNILMAAVGRLVPDEWRAFSFGLIIASASFGQFIFSPLGQGFIQGYGWANALLFMASFMIIVPMLALNLGLPKSQSNKTGENTKTTTEDRENIKELLVRAFASKSFVLLLLGFFTCGFHIAFVSTNLPAYITDIGFGSDILPAVLSLPFGLTVDFGLGLGAFAIALIGIFNIIGSIGSGVLSSRGSRPYLLASIYFARAFVFLIFFITPPSTWSVILFSASLGLLWLSTVAPTSSLVSLFFGPKNLGMMYGLVFLSHQVGGFFGAWLSGISYELNGNYDIMWYASIFLGLVSGFLNLPIKEQTLPKPA